MPRDRLPLVIRCTDTSPERRGLLEDDLAVQPVPPRLPPLSASSATSSSQSPPAGGAAPHAGVCSAGRCLSQIGSFLRRVPPAPNEGFEVAAASGSAQRQDYGSMNSGTAEAGPSRPTAIPMASRSVLPLSPMSSLPPLSSSLSTSTSTAFTSTLATPVPPTSVPVRLAGESSTATATAVPIPITAPLPLAMTSVQPPSPPSTASSASNLVYVRKPFPHTADLLGSPSERTPLPCPFMPISGIAPAPVSARAAVDTDVDVVMHDSFHPSAPPAQAGGTDVQHQLATAGTSLIAPRRHLAQEESSEDRLDRLRMRMGAHRVSLDRARAQDAARGQERIRERERSRDYTWGSGSGVGRSRSRSRSGSGSAVDTLEGAGVEAEEGEGRNVRPRLDPYSTFQPQILPPVRYMAAPFASPVPISPIPPFGYAPPNAMDAPHQMPGSSIAVSPAGITIGGPRPRPPLGVAGPSERQSLAPLPTGPPRPLPADYEEDQVEDLPSSPLSAAMEEHDWPFPHLLPAGERDLAGGLGRLDGSVGGLGVGDDSYAEHTSMEVDGESEVESDGEYEGGHLDVPEYTSRTTSNSSTTSSTDEFARRYRQPGHPAQSLDLSPSRTSSDRPPLFAGSFGQIRRERERYDHNHAASDSATNVAVLGQHPPSPSASTSSSSAASNTLPTEPVPYRAEFNVNANPHPWYASSASATAARQAEMRERLGRFDRVRAAQAEAQAQLELERELLQRRAAVMVQRERDQRDDGAISMADVWNRSMRQYRESAPWTSAPPASSSHVRGSAPSPVPYPYAIEYDISMDPYAQPHRLGDSEPTSAAASQMPGHPTWRPMAAAGSDFGRRRAQIMMASREDPLDPLAVTNAALNSPTALTESSASSHSEVGSNASVPPPRRPSRLFGESPDLVPSEIIRLPRAYQQPERRTDAAASVAGASGPRPPGMLAYPRGTARPVSIASTSSAANSAFARQQGLDWPLPGTSTTRERERSGLDSHPFLRRAGLQRLLLDVGPEEMLEANVTSHARWDELAIAAGPASTTDVSAAADSLRDRDQEPRFRSLLGDLPAPRSDIPPSSSHPGERHRSQRDATMPRRTTVYATNPFSGAAMTVAQDRATVVSESRRPEALSRRSAQEAAAAASPGVTAYDPYFPISRAGMQASYRSLFHPNAESGLSPADSAEVRLQRLRDRAATARHWLTLDGPMGPGVAEGYLGELDMLRQPASPPLTAGTEATASTSGATAGSSTADVRSVSSRAREIALTYEQPDARIAGTAARLRREREAGAGPRELPPSLQEYLRSQRTPHFPMDGGIGSGFLPGDYAPPIIPPTGAPGSLRASMSAKEKRDFVTMIARATGRLSGSSRRAAADTVMNTVAHAKWNEKFGCADVSPPQELKMDARGHPAPLGGWSSESPKIAEERKASLMKVLKGLEKESACSICQDDYEPDSELTVTPCKHSYHKSCLDMWLNQPNSSAASCPMCRRDMAVLACLTRFVPKSDVLEAHEIWMSV